MFSGLITMWLHPHFIISCFSLDNLLQHFGKDSLGVWISFFSSLKGLWLHRGEYSAALPTCLYDQTAKGKQHKRTILSLNRRTSFCSTIAPAVSPYGRHKIAHTENSPDKVSGRKPFLLTPCSYSLWESELCHVPMQRSTAQAGNNTDCSCPIALSGSFIKGY